MMIRSLVRPARCMSGAVLSIALLIAVFGPGCSMFQGSVKAPADVPADLEVKGPIVGSVHATGFQVYTCQRDADKMSWKLKAPDATFDGDFKGKHYAGPTWEAADGSKVVGTKLAEHAAPVDAVPWLLLKATSHTGVLLDRGNPPKEGKGKLSEVTYIQRLHTTGGEAPALGVAKPGDEVRIAYTADYIFYGPGGTIGAVAK